MTGRLTALIGAVIALWTAVASPFAHLDHHLLTGHMVQHLLLMVVAAPLTLIASGSGRSLPLVFCWLAGSLTVIFWHVPGVFAMALRSHYWHTIEQISFVLAGILFWTPAIVATHRGSGWSVPVYLFLATLPCDALSAYLVFCGHIVYPSYMSGGGLFRLTPLDDQALAGALMWVVVTFAYLLPALVLSARLLSNEQRAAAQSGVA